MWFLVMCPGLRTTIIIEVPYGASIMMQYIYCTVFLIELAFLSIYKSTSIIRRAVDLKPGPADVYVPLATINASFSKLHQERFAQMPT